MLLSGKVMHARLAPKINQFIYNIYYLLLPLECIEDCSLNQYLALNRFGLHSFHTKDHGYRDQRSLRQWVSDIHQEHNIQMPNKIILMCMPRVLGYVFNPVSFWLGLDLKGNIKSIIYEVNNTFGESHSYICDASNYQPQSWLKAKKCLHVSPFLPVAGHYEFAFSIAKDNTKILINYHLNQKLTLKTSLVGKHTKLSKNLLLRKTLAQPLQSLKVIILIHYQALKLWQKNINFHKQPSPPSKQSSKYF